MLQAGLVGGNFHLFTEHAEINPPSGTVRAKLVTGRSRCF